MRGFDRSVSGLFVPKQLSIRAGVCAASLKLRSRRSVGTIPEVNRNGPPPCVDVVGYENSFYCLYYIYIQVQYVLIIG